MDLSILGLTRYEMAVYQALIAHGTAPASAVSKTASVPYGRIYDVLASLEDKGLVKVLPEQPKKFLPSAPTELQRLVDERKAALTALSEEVRRLEQLYDEHDEVAVLMAQGKRNFYRIEKEMKSAKEFSYRIKYNVEFHPQFVKGDRRARKRGLEMKTLARDDDETREDIGRWLREGMEMRSFPNDGVAMAVNDTGVLIGLIKSNTTLLITDGPFIDVMKRLFEAAYVDAPTVTPK